MAGNWMDSEADTSLPFLRHSLSDPDSELNSPRPTLRSFHSSPLNPATPLMPPVVRPTTSRMNSANNARMSRIPSEESRALSMVGPSKMPSRGSMILYRKAEPITPGSYTSDDVLLPPHLPHMARSSVYSTSGDSYISISSDSKYPMATLPFHAEHGLVAYAYDPDLDEKGPPDEEDMMHDPTQRYHHNMKKGAMQMSIRGVVNMSTIILMIVCILCLFVGYPVISFYIDNGTSLLITHNTRINATGQASFSNFSPGDDTLIGSFSDYIDRTTPKEVYSFVGTNAITYELVFSDEFNVNGSTFHHNENLFWEGRDRDLASPEQLTTEEGQLVFRINPLTTASSAGQQYISGIMDATVPFCLGHGFAEIGMKESSGITARVFWAGGAWSYTNAAVANHVPAGPSLNKDVILSLSFGVLATRIPRTTSPEDLPASVAVDYVRYYGRKVDPGYSRGACDVSRSERKSVTLDLLSVLR